MISDDLFRNIYLCFRDIINEPISFQFFFQLLPGHSRRLHSSISVECPGQEPWSVSSTSLTRVFVLEPSPHVVEHCPRQGPHTQSSAEIADRIELCR